MTLSNIIRYANFMPSNITKIKTIELIGGIKLYG